MNPTLNNQYNLFTFPSFCIRNTVIVSLRSPRALILWKVVGISVISLQFSLWRPISGTRRGEAGAINALSAGPASIRTHSLALLWLVSHIVRRPLIGPSHSLPSHGGLRLVRGCLETGGERSSPEGQRGAAQLGTVRQPWQRQCRLHTFHEALIDATNWLLLKDCEAQAKGPLILKKKEGSVLFEISKNVSGIYEILFWTTVFCLCFRIYDWQVNM